LADDVALVGPAAGLDELVVTHAKERALIDDLGAEDCGARGGGFFRAFPFRGFCFGGHGESFF
jgi:hypothetical protein